MVLGLSRLETCRFGWTWREQAPSYGYRLQLLQRGRRGMMRLSLSGIGSGRSSTKDSEGSVVSGCGAPK